MLNYSHLFRSLLVQAPSCVLGLLLLLVAGCATRSTQPEPPSAKELAHQFGIVPPQPSQIAPAPAAPDVPAPENPVPDSVRERSDGVPPNSLAGSGPAADGRTNRLPAAPAAECQIHPGDTVHVAVYREEDISGDFKVSPDGSISHPLLGRVSLGGMTSSGAEQKLIQLLDRDYLVNPRVAVQVSSSYSRQVIVLGEVKRPGVYEVPTGERFTLLQAIAMAGGFTDIAAIDRVVIVRKEKDREISLKVKVSDLLSGRGRSEDVALQVNDVITVPQTVF